MRTTTVRAAVLAAIATALVGCAKSPESTVESFYQAVAAGEITEARSYVSKDIVQMMGEEKLTNSLSAETQRVQGCGGITNIDVRLQDGAEVRFGTATVSYETCPEKQENLKLVMEDGGWKLAANK